MMHWNHRVCKLTTNGEVTIGIHEVYYNEAGEICSATENPIRVYGYSLSALGEMLAGFQGALSKPIVDLDTITFAESGW